MKILKLNVSVILLFISVLSRVNGGIVGFETLPDGNVSIDNYELDFNSAYDTDNVSVTYGFDTTGNSEADTNGIIEMIGVNLPDGFTNSELNINDRAALGYEDQLGSFFLRPSSSSSTFGTFIIKYTSSILVTESSGEIWDIDRNAGSQLETEQFLVQAFDASHVLLDSIRSPLGDDFTLDAKPWTFGFSGLTQGINQIEISFVGSKKTGIGLAFNGHSPVEDISIPEPSGFLLMSISLFGIAWQQRKIPPCLRSGLLKGGLLRAIFPETNAFLLCAGFSINRIYLSGKLSPLFDRFNIYL